MQTEKFIAPEGNATLTVIENEYAVAKPLPLKEPKSLSFTGDIHAISEFVKVRRSSAAGIQALNVNTIVVEVSKKDRGITMHLDPESHYNCTVTAKLEQSDELKQFGINTLNRYDRKQLLQLLKFNRLYFDDRLTYNKVISGLTKIRMKTQQEINQESDGKGNRVNNDESRSVAQDGFQDTFTLNIPLFKGFAPVKIDVEICFEVKDSNISFWLESVGLKDATESAIDDIFAAELANVSDFVIIHR
jgi:hypothetical protein